ncbi:hypothetical protein BN946_scf184977.g46 [Trametes cinnabarina]|uniref:DUF1764-domain-containing protein n=1 Tax=Pycnoporus cinnabarinus TaxID=5643 RepID=A0A060SJH1_PYCCI|nr:hypothetical protein BN946_scf184977.g46 [Trametes cinnabarina]
MPPSEIDAIFASKGTSSLPAPSPSSSSQPSEKKSKKKKKGKSAKRKRDHADPMHDSEDLAPPKPVKRKVPETVFDPSASLPSLKANARKPHSTVGAPPNVKKPKKVREDEARFKDSRGTGPRRTTEEGFAIYKEDELGITDQGGDTPLCPFDCQCCF